MLTSAALTCIFVALMQTAQTPTVHITVPVILASLKVEKNVLNAKMLQALPMLTGKKRTLELFYATVHSVQIGFVSREQLEIKWLPHVFQPAAVELMPLAG
ncbi:hypothetical protein AWC38_SpisGene16724 [Stylophora pistillata]|uniref:Secreted protein n=1 Tax=Stylophora pistillata TaxID=50429 RepID=A0A2B4RKF7_STYPI|nr:hypothetical protein AWC38_SpisGene16724 [Stylophora pistillata]